MSSEDKSVDPSDQGPSPPLSSAGATPSGSPAPADKRPRGRPRKDAPVPKPKRKSRSRGRAQADDEDSMDGTDAMDATDATQPPEIDVTPEMEVELEVDEEDFPQPLDLSPRDEPPLSPLFQRSVSEDSAGSSASTTGNAKTREKLCAFCYCGERSLLGQGELKLFGPTPGYVPLHIRNRRGSSEKDDDYHEDEDNDFEDSENARSPGTRIRGLKKISSPDSGLHSTSAPGSTDPFGEEPSHKLWDELGQIGLPDDINVQSLFDPTGQCCAHLRCAAWSDGVWRGEGGQAQLYVDKAIDSGSTEYCAYCKRLGASIKCCEEGCSRSYHYPCAAAAGTFQDIRRYSLLCPDHIQLAHTRSKDAVNCLVCDSPGDLQDQLFCTSCGQHYHGACLDITVTPLRRAGWQCPDCKVCLTCKNPGEDSKMLVCDMCDKGYHTFCLQPVMDSIPTSGWRCKNCRTCAQCGVRSNGQWSSNTVLCECCQQQQDPTLFCHICGRGRGQDDDDDALKDTLACSTCKRWVHTECERRESSDPGAQVRCGYTCSVCKQVETDTQAQGAQETTLDDPEAAKEVFIAVEEEEEEEGVSLEPETTAVPVHEEPAESPSVDAAQEIQVTVTLTEGPASPQHSTALSAVSPLSSQSSSAVVERDDEASCDAITPMETETETGKGDESTRLPEPEERKPSVDASKAVFASPTKETSCPELSPSSAAASPPAVQTSEPMDLGPSAAPESSEETAKQENPVQSKVPLPLPEDDIVQEQEKESTDLQQHPQREKEEEQEEEEDDEEEEEEEEVTSEPASALPEEGSVPPAVERSPTLEMDTTPASELSFSGFSSPAGEEKGLNLKRSPGLSPDGSAKLSQSPFSTEASPRETPTHPQYQSGYSPSVPPIAFFPITPKIGMGKPAISKRKFSPGRPRVKQVAWSSRSSVSSPSWSPERPEGWDGPKSRQLLGEHVWTAKVGRGSGFPGRRRPRGSNLSGRGGRGRSRLKTDSSLLVTPGVSFVETPYVVKEEEENAMHNTVVLFSSSDAFTLKQDMCVVCGSFGQGAEGRLLACSQCGQCYHPFCVSIKMNKVVLSKGWRCLECTVCEACGQASDPGRLLLCDDCDISYHTYCLDPPLQNVPKGSWKCKWCVSCTHCGATSPGLRCDWQNNYTQCGPCASLAVCPVCTRSYREEELILQCRQCDRWMHACCQGLNSDEEAENAADDGFDCTMCRMHTACTQGPAGPSAKLMETSEPPIVAQIVSKIKEYDFQKTYTQDGVCLTESGLCQLQSLSVPSVRRRRTKPKLKLKIINQNSVAVLQTPPDPQSELSREGDLDDSREGDLMDCDVKSDSSPEREPIDEEMKGAESVDGMKKRKRKPYRPGIGGFMVRQRSKTGQGKAKRSLSRKDSTGSLTENPLGKEEGWNEPDTPVDETPPVIEPLEKVKKRYRKKKTKLEEAFPSYLQEAFFGKELLDKSKQRRPPVETAPAEDESAHSKPLSTTSSFLDPSSDPLLSAAATPIISKMGRLPSAEDPLDELVLQSDDDLLGMLSDDLVKPGPDSAGLDIGGISDDPSGTPEPAPARGPRQLQEEPLDVILNPVLDKIVTDGAILSKLPIPELEGKDVEDLFTVLSPSTSQSPQIPQPPNPVPNVSVMPMPHHGPVPGDGGMFPRMPVMNGMMGANPIFPPNAMMPAAGVSGTFSPIHRMPFPEGMREKKFGQMGSDMVGPWSAPVPMSPAPPAEAETDTMSNAQRSTLKWEKEETLGEMATVAPVLYTNVNFPNLREEFPDWSTRVKQIAKLWRKASSQERAPYVQKARDNRAALRINKVQLSNDTMKRQQQQQQQTTPDPFDSSLPMDAELLFKDPLKQKESEHEQEWKFRQGELNQMWGPLKKQQEKVPKSKAIKSTNKDVLFGHSNQATIAAGCGKNSLQMRQKSKQQAKIEATQKLEQVKNEQQQLQQQQQFGGVQSGGDPLNSGNESPVGSQHTGGGGGGGDTSPLQHATLKDNFSRPQLPGTPTSSSSSSSDDVFLRPQPPPPSSVAKTPTQDSQYQQGSSSQPQSPQMFSPGSSSSRPSSPFDPYTKMVGTPRPPPSGSSTPRRGSLSDGQERGRPSPAHESFGSPKSLSADVYSKPPDTPRPSDPFLKPLGPLRPVELQQQQQQQFQQQGRYMLANTGAMPGDNFTRPNHRPEIYQRMPNNRMVLSDPYSRPLLTPIPGSNESGSVPIFKTPMPPSHSQQDMMFGPGQQGLRRGPPDGFSQGQNDPYAHQPLTPHPSMGDTFGNEGRMMRPTSAGPFAQPMPMSRYVQAPSTPRPDYSQQMPDPYSQPPGTPRPHDTYVQPPGTPRPHSDPYSMPPSTPRPNPMDQFSQSQPSSRRQSPSHAMDPYAQMPGTPRPAPGDRYPKSPGSQRNPDMYAQPPGTPRPAKSDPYDQPPGTPRPLLTDPYAQPPGTPRPGPMVHPSDPFSNQAPNRMQDHFARPAGPGSQTPKHPGISDEGFSLPQNNPNQTPVHDPFEQAPDRLAHGPTSASGSADAQNAMQPPGGDTEEKLKQRQRLRQLILKQQQAKCAIRQEKGLQEATGTPAPGTPMHWSQEDSAPQSEIFGRPPPPYPGPMRASPMQGGPRFPGPLLGDHRAPFPDEAQCPRPSFPREMGAMGMRPQGPRFGFPPVPPPGQDPFLRPPHQMQGGLLDTVPPQMRRSLSMDLPRAALGNPQMGLPQHFPPRGLPMQQHSIMGQPFIELRHRAPENRVRLPFGPPNMMEQHPNHPQRPSTTSFIGAQNMAFPGTPGNLRQLNPQLMVQPQHGPAAHMQMSTSMENLHQQGHIPVNAAPQHPQPSTSNSLAQQVNGEALNSSQPALLPVSVPGPAEEISLPCGDGMEEKLDTDDDLVDDDLGNLNLDTDDGKDIDLHLDDIIECGKFDLIAYAMNPEDKKDMFNEELELSDPIEDDHGETSDQNVSSENISAPCGEGASSSSPLSKPVEKLEDGHLIHGHSTHVKQEENQLKEDITVKREGNQGNKGNHGGVSSLFEAAASSTSSSQQTGLSNTDTDTVNSSSAPVLSGLLTKEKLELEDSSIGSDPDLQTNMNIMMMQAQDNAMNPGMTMGHRMDPSLAHATSMGNPNMMPATNQQLPVQGFGASPAHQVDLNLSMVGQQPVSHALHPQTQQAMFTQVSVGQQASKLLQNQQNRPLLLDEQPLLLQDLLDQERQEQQQQRQMQAMIRQRSSDPFFPNIDFDAITDPIMKAKMVALKGINKVMAQNSIGMTPMVMNRMQQMPGTPGPQGPDPASFPPQMFGQDGKLIPQLARPNPPNFGPGFVNDAQREQYEEWLQETQQLLQMQQKFLEDQIGAHRKSKKALSAKQRTAKKAGREFPEEDAEQLKHVTEQQSVVQKQLEQIRKQQKEHSELIEEYRVKQQRSLQPPAMMTPMPPMPGMQGQAPGMMPGGPHMPQPIMGPMQPHPGQPSPARMPGWHPVGPGPMGGPRMPQSHMPPQMPPAANSVQPPQAQPPASMVAGGPIGQPGSSAAAGHGAGAAGSGGAAPHVKFDDNNPFSEGFQERERRERLREQQERQRVQLMQEVERQRALQRMEREQQKGAGVVPDTNREGLAHMPFFSSDLPQDFMQPTRPQQPPQQQQQQQQISAMFPQQGVAAAAGGGGGGPLDFGGPGPATFIPTGERRPIAAGVGAFPPAQEMGPNFRLKNPAMHGHGLNFIPSQPRPPAMLQGGAEDPLFGMESATPLPPNYPGSGQSLIQLYSNIIPEEKGKKKRNRKKKKDDDAESIKTPSTPHSDLTAPLTPCVSDTSSTPTRSVQDLSEFSNPLSSMSSGLPPPSELERQLSGSGANLLRRGSETERGFLDEAHEIKQEKLEVSECRGAELEVGAEHRGMVKVEESGERISPSVPGHSPSHSTKGESGNELLKHLLKNKSTPPPGAQLTHQTSCDSLRSDEEAVMDRKGSDKMDCLGGVNSQLPGHTDSLETCVPEQGKKKQRNKRTPKTGAEKPQSRWKKRKKEQEERQVVYPTTDTLMTQLKQQLSLLPLMEPLIGVNFTHFPPYGSGQLNGENRLSGSFGCASLDGVSDYYSQLIYKQNNLSNPPTPPASLPPTPPPVARQKLVNGFATAEELARKAAVMTGHEVSKSLGSKHLPTPFRGEEDLLAQAISQGPKTVDVPASLPTPPHTNQEELRGQDHCSDRDTPDSFVPSSSPESVVGMEISRYPDLSLVKDEPLSPAMSPTIPMLPSASGKGTELKQWEVKKEPQSSFFGSQFEHTSSYSKAGLMSIALTLNQAAAENIHGVVAAVAELLCVPVPANFEVIRTPGPEPRSSLAMLAGIKVPQTQPLDPRHASLFPQAAMRFPRLPGPSGPPGMVAPNQNCGPHNHAGPAAVRQEYQMDGSSPGLKPQWCANCKVVVLGNGVRKSSKDLPIQKQEGRPRAEGSAVFCSHNCLVLYSSAVQTKPADSKPNAAVLPEDSEDKNPAKVLHQYSTNVSTMDVHCLAQMQPKQSPPSTPPIFFPSVSPETPKAEVKPDALKVTVKLKPRPRAVHGGEDSQSRMFGKRWKGLRWRKWSVQIVIPRGNLQVRDDGELELLLQKLDASLRPEPLPKDLRRCCFCHEEGDGLTDGPARLLNLDLDVWVHLNCALWSTEVYETQAGALINVELALRRGLSVRCAYCQQTGATSGCHRLRCTNAYHFTCALKAQCTFFKDKTMLCHLHRPRGNSNSFGVGTLGGMDHELRCFAVFRRVYVQRDEARQIASIVQRGEREHTFRVGSLVFHAVGQLLPQQMEDFHSSAAIFPVGYEASRIYWSMRHGNRRCRYLCSIDEKDGEPEFSIRVIEQGYEDLLLTGSSPKGVWDKVLEPVADRRNETGILKLFPVYLKGEDLFGLTVPAVTRIVESLPGVEACSRYTFRYGRNPLMELPLAINPSGCARSEPKALTHVKRPHTLTSGSTIKTLQTNGGSPAELTGVPYSKQFVHSKSSQYRRMKAEWKSNVYLARSRIQGLGLYAARDIEKDTLVIEYIGTIIRNEVANRKEKMYESQNRGVYMFRIDSEHVIDATITGGPARYINHSCAPNCIAEVVTFEKDHKIMITSNRRIQRGEELCYDYKFDLEDDQHKIPCHCGAVNCRKWMN
ncbi:histone-lysine N-methyltransferase 2C isoform X2 [Astyanax mexicanus]|uniref:histone-lysine N-methyltransferase 2C isoform X2 n=1 Tax=Astyanax mexicanus TaxID=7994 RepID=UPI0020CAAEB5|nr:histone-lysine N-methyltransferase 2C isoform X2 [Astyanax mexicanus]